MTETRTRRAETQPRLIALLDGRVIGAVFQDNRSRLRFDYDETWREAEDSYPLSLSMPLTAEEHQHDAISAYLWGLLPDNESTLEHYGRTFGVSARNPVAILAHIGADCAGAIQLVPPNRVDEIRGGAGTEVEWISEADVAQELRLSKEIGLPGRDRRTLGRFSLAGAQPKIALFRDLETGQWGRPIGRTPTTHILKPPSNEFKGFAENEHFCLDLASQLGLRAVESAVKVFETEIAIVVDRFDRVVSGREVRRIHQEDMCQALSVLPWNKYENDGGPGVPEVVGLIQESSLEPEVDVDRFIDATVLNWVLAATDAHAKNFAFVHLPGGGVRLAPFYDVASFLPYADRRLYEIKSAMRIGREYLVRRIALADWKRLADSARLPEQRVIGRLESLLQLMPDATSTVERRAIEQGLDPLIIGALAARIKERAVECAKTLRLGSTAA